MGLYRAAEAMTGMAHSNALTACGYCVIVVVVVVVYVIITGVYS